MTRERPAPEQLHGDLPSTSTDVWALGVLLYELLTGRLPFKVAWRSHDDIEREQWRRAAEAERRHSQNSIDGSGRPDQNRGVARDNRRAIARGAHRRSRDRARDGLAA